MMAILTKTISRNQWKIMLLLRLSPVMPYNVLNYSLSMVENLSIVAYTTTAALGNYIFLKLNFFYFFLFFNKILFFLRNDSR
jgi:uncharacterized membrane protein YdjX (TVP38/TMEM64 family)